MRSWPLVLVAAAVLLVPETARGQERRATLYAFFATWCVPCRVEIPHLERLHRTYADQGLEVVLVSEDAPSTAANVPAFLDRFGVTARWRLDSESALLSRYHPAATVPFTVLLDAHGRVVYAHTGYEPGDERELESQIVKLLARPASPERSGARITTALQSLGVMRRNRFDPNGVDDGRLDAAAGRLEASGRTDRAGATVRVDGAVINGLDDVDDQTDARLERLAVDGTFGPVTVKAGDSYAAFGHGVALSLRKIDPLGVDTTLQGARVDAHIGQARVTALAGLANPQNLDPIELRVVDPVKPLVSLDTQDAGLLVDGPRDALGGGEVRLALTETSHVAAYALSADARGAAPDGGDVTWALGGAAVTVDVDSVRFAADVAAGRRSGLNIDDETPWAVYTSTQIRTGPVTTLLETKAYRRWLLGRPEQNLLYHEPPTLEREDQEVPSNSDAAGVRLRSEWRLPGELTVFGNVLGYRYSLDGRDPLQANTAWHAYAGAEKRFGDALSAAIALGARDENDPDGSDRLSLWHVDLDAAWSAHENLALTVKWNHRTESKVAFRTIDFVRGLAVLGAAWPGRVAVAFLYGYSTEAQNPDVPTHYPAGELRVLLPRGGDLRLFAGRLVGGRVCVSGTCRDVPPFEGLRLDLVVRY